MWKNLWWDKARGEDARPSRAGPWTQPIGTVHDEELAADIQVRGWTMSIEAVYLSYKFNYLHPSGIILGWLKKGSFKGTA